MRNAKSSSEEAKYTAMHSLLGVKLSHGSAIVYMQLQVGRVHIARGGIEMLAKIQGRGPDTGGSARARIAIEIK
jgi:hypothetical protein